MTSRSSGASPFLSAARDYAERGWPVFPLIAREKKPLTPNGVLDASTDRNQILEWWQLFPAANVAIATGFVCDVLDIDGPEPVQYLQGILGRDWRHGGPVCSTGKGHHLYFATLDGARNRASIEGHKLDYRGTGGYVVAPPSIHPSGARYQWLDNRGPQLQLPPIPEQLRGIILKIVRTTQRPAAWNQGLERGSITLTPRGEKIYARPDIFEVVEQDLKQAIVSHGMLYATNCIFHSDKNPSLVLYPDNTFHCYACEAHGDSFDLRARIDITGRPAITGI